jgi:hypothetical protein
MRDGVHLYTLILKPKDARNPLPEDGELAYVIGTCAFVTTEEEKLLKNKTLNWIEILRHQKICDRESCVFSLSAEEPSSTE